MQINNNIIEFNFNHYLFKTSFIKAYLIRNLQYKYISQKKPISSLMRYTVNLKDIDSLDLIIVKGNKSKLIKICRNGISKNTILSREITKSHFYKSYISAVIYKEFMESVITINERIYDHFK